MNLHYWDKKKLQFVSINKTNVIRGAIFILGFSVITSVITYKYGFNVGKKSEIIEKDVVLLYMDSENNSFSRRNFYEYLKEVNVKFPELVFAQAIKESGLKSPLFKGNHNPFGMKEANKRPNMQNGSQDGHAYYDTWKHSVIDYAMYQSYVGLSKVKTEGEYLQYLKEMNYFDVDYPGNVNYLNDLKHIRDNIENYLKE